MLRNVVRPFGIAILGSVLNQAYRDGMADAVVGLPPAVAERVLGSIAFTAAPEVQQLGAAGQALVAPARNAFVSGVGDAVLVGGIVLVVAAVAVFVLAPREVERHASEPVTAPSWTLGCGAQLQRGPAPAVAHPATNGERRISHPSLVASCATGEGRTSLRSSIVAPRETARASEGRRRPSVLPRATRP